jgi:formate-dependent nitrite reductase cytochrome c552 subunit
MKSLFKLISMAFLGALVIIACEGPMGPAGKDGVDGIDGIDGVDGTAKCSVCHNNSSTIIAKQLQYENSQHGEGEEAAYANGRTSGDCQKCHTNEGFHEFLAGGNVHQNFVDVQQPNCYTCHNVHKDFAETDYALTTTASVTFMNGIGGPYNNTADGGTSNLCANCHQARAASPAIPAVGGSDVVISGGGTRWGPHYSSVSNIMTNTGGYHIAGTLTYTANHAHKALSCTSCHMATPYGDKAGGHTMAFRYDSHGTEMVLQSGCISCHSETNSSPTYLFNKKVNDSRDAINAMLAELKTELIRLGIYNATTGLANVGTYSADVAGAFWNYKVAVGDGDDAGGLYAHNPPYTKALLQNSIDKLKTLP